MLCYQEPTLALLRRFAVCTEVIVLRGTTAHHTNKLPVNHSPSSTASHSSSKGQKAATPAATSSESRSDSEKSTTESERHSYPGDEKVLSPGFAEARVLEGGVTVLFRHFIVVDEVDMGVLNPQDESTPPGLSGMTMDPSIRRHPIDDSSVNMGDPKGRDPSVAEITRESFSIPRSPLASAPTRHPPHFVIDSTSGSQPVGDSFSYTGGSFIGGNPSIANNVPAAEGNTSAVSNRKGQPRQPQYQPQQKHRHQEQQEQTSARSVSMALLTVREAMVVKLAAVSHHRAHSTFKNPGTGAGDTTPSRNFSGPKIHPKHERESISVVGLLAEVGFRVQGGSGDAGVAGSRRKSSPSSKAPPSSTISRPAAAAYTSTDKSRYGDQAIAAKSAVDYPGRFGGCSARVGFGNGGVLLSDATSDPARGKRGEVLGRGGKTSPRLGEGSRTSTSQQKQHLVDMFQRVAEQGLQLCLTLAQGVDKVCVYMSVSPESWPPGMIPGHAVVQVRGHVNQIRIVQY